MPIPIRFYTVIVAEDVADQRVEGGAAALQHGLQARLDEGMLHWACMSPAAVSELVQTLREKGLHALRSDPASEVAVVDMHSGLTGACGWLILDRSAPGLRVRLAAADGRPSPAEAQ
jgi:hypothetical protein